MTPKEYLKQTDGLNRYINQLLEEVEELRQLSDSISAVQYGERINTGTKANEAPFVRCLIKIAGLEEKINKNVDKLIDLKMGISDAIDELKDVDERILLRARYVNGKSWDSITTQLSLSLRSVHRIHSQALQNFRIPDKVGTYPHTLSENVST
jgi:DNA-directed RNA polymerase specialized sigma subunit